MAGQNNPLKKLVKQVLTEKENKRYERLLSARSMTYEQWCNTVSFEENLWDAEEVDWNFEILTAPNGRIADGAKEIIARYFAQHPEVLVIYGDEDVWPGEGHTETSAGATSDKERRCPWFKPDWSPDLFDSWYYLGSLVAVRKELLEHCPRLGTMRPGEEGFVDRMRECLELCEGWKPGCEAIGHIPQVLFHCSGEEVIKQYMEWQTRIEKKDVNGKVSIIIPSKDHPEILENCLSAIDKYNKKLNCELIIVDNGSAQTNKEQIEILLKKYEKTHDEPGESTVKYLYHPMEFNFSRMCNLGAEAAEGDFLLFLNDDVELCVDNSLQELMRLAAGEHAGAVGMKLYYPDSDRIQHAGITNLPMGPVHKLQFLKDGEVYYFNANRGVRNVLAVTAACLMVDARKFHQVGGFDEGLRVAFNDVDLCFKLQEQGYKNICNNGCYAYHHESLSRGDDESTEKWQRLLAERDCLYEKHPQLENKDPYYGAGLGREGLDTRIRPAFETAGNRSRRVGSAERGMAAQGIRMLDEKLLAECRQDACLLLRIENCRQNVIQGYGVVLGDNNACYEKELLLRPVSSEEKAGDPGIVGISIEGQYRPDLIENMPDQCNVGLSGLWIEFEGQQIVMPGEYEIGMLARNRVTGLKLINWTNRIFKI